MFEFFQEFCDKVCDWVSDRLPDILTYGGAASSIVGTGLAVKRAFDAKDQLDALFDAQEVLEEEKEDPSIDEQTLATEEELYLEIRRDTIKNVVKLFALPVALELLGVGSMILGHHILDARIDGLAAAYMALKEKYDAYRKRVADEFGEDKEKELYNGKPQQVYDEDGNLISVNDPVSLGAFRIDFNENCQGFQLNREANLGWLHAVESFANNMLQKRGYLFLNDIYHQMGLRGTKEGQILGWLLENKDGSLNRVDFGLDNIPGLDSPWITFSVTPDGYILKDKRINRYLLT